MIRAVLFDLDGVIVDSLDYHYLAWQHVFEKYGGTVNRQTILLQEGRKSSALLPILMQESGVLIPEHQQDAFIEEKRLFYRRSLKIAYYPESFGVIDTLRRRGLKVALVTGSAFQNMEHALNRKQRSCFDFILTGDEVERSKPDPEPYLKAAVGLKLEPEACAVVENAPLGIEAAKAARMYCFAIASTLESKHLRSADCILKSIGDLIHQPLFTIP
jgi:beta-phosphoglucomutase